MVFSNNIVQGGQVFQHRLRMLKQLIGLSVKLGLIIGIPYYIYHVYSSVPVSIWQGSVRYIWGLLYKYILWHEESAPVTDPVSQQVVSLHLLLLPLHRLQALSHLPVYLLHSLWQALKILGWIMSGIFFYWFFRGQQNKKKHHVEGTRVVKFETLKRTLKQQQNLSPYTLSGLPLPHPVLGAHFLVSGTTGAGKTTLFHSFLPQVRAQKGKAVIVDSTGEFVAKYYRPGHDVLLNPLDERFPGWSPWSELVEPYHYEEFAAHILPSPSHADPFWVNAARTVLVEAMKKREWHGEKIEALLKRLLTSPLNILHRHLKDTRAAPFLDPDVEKTSLSIRAALASGLQSLTLLGQKTEQENGFSIREWVQGETANSENTLSDDRWLFLYMTPPQRDSLTPLLSLWLSQVISSVMELKPAGGPDKQRLWFFLDELPALQKLAGLTKCLAEGRKYGATMFLGLQNVAQLESLYGPQATSTILDLCSTKVLLRLPSYEIAERMSRSVGEQEVREVQEGISYGANDMRDGVNLNTTTRRRPALYADNLMRLDNLEGYIKLAGNYPVAKIKIQ